MASEAGGTPANGVTQSTHVPSSTSAENQTAGGRLPGKPSAKPTTEAKSGTLEQMAKDAVKKTAPAQPQESDDDEIEVFGEKLRRSEYKRLRDAEAKRQEHIKAANGRFEEAAKLRKAAEQREAQLTQALQQFKQNPAALFQAAQIDPALWAEQQLTQALKRREMTPDQIELERTRQELEAVRRQNAEAQEQAKQAQFKQQQQRWFEFFDRAIGTALNSGGIPRTPRTADRVRQVYADLIDAGHQIDESTTALALEIARDNMMTETQELLGGVAKESPKLLVEMLGGLDGEIVKTIQRLAVERHEAVAPRPKPVARPAPKPQTKGPPTFEDVRKQLGM